MFLRCSLYLIVVHFFLTSPLPQPPPPPPLPQVKPDSVGNTVEMIGHTLIMNDKI